jgi:uncharacterized phage protein gp47/JayE
MSSYPLATLAPTIDSTGISAPSYEDIYQSLLASFRLIYGSGVYVTADSQDGQWIAVLALAIYESNQAAIACFLSFSPTYAQGAGLSALTLINGLTRKSSSLSTAPGTVIGVAGTVITSGVVKDISGNSWNLPPVVIVPIGGSVTATVTSQKPGATVAPSGTINSIATPQLGWQTFTSTADATPGAAVESDAELRLRQTTSTALPALTILESMSAAIGNVPGVTRYICLENDTSATDANGIPAHSLAVVVQGGDSAAIGAAISSKKSIGAQTFGTTSVIVYGTYGLSAVVNYFVLAPVPIYYAITIKALPGYVSSTGVSIINALAAFTNELAIGEDVYTAQAQAAASLITLGVGQTFYVTAFALGISPAPTGTTPLVILFNQAASSLAADITLTVI